MPARAATLILVVEPVVEERQQGQLLLSIVSSVVGLAALIAGLKRQLPMLRSAALVWLMITVAKVFLYDLSTLTCELSTLSRL